MESEEEYLVNLAICLGNLAKEVLAQKRRKRRKRFWMKSFYKSRNRYNGNDMLADLLKEPSGGFFNFCRMSSEDFEYLLGKIDPHISRQGTPMRDCISSKERLAVTLRYLATGDSYKSLSYLFKFSPSSISLIIPEVCEALINILRDCIKTPKTPQEWRKIEKGFNNKWNFPHCCGAIDGKHIVIQAPIQSGSEYFNYKTTFSVVLMAVCDAEYNIIYANVGCQGRISDGGVFKNTKLYEKLENGTVNFPPEEPLPHMNLPLPYFIVGDNAFALKEYMLVPYPGTHSAGSKKRILNFRLSRARRTIENVFGIMSAVFRIFRKPILLNTDTVQLIVRTCLFLHNFIRNSKTSRTNYLENNIDIEVNDQLTPGSWREESSPRNSFLNLKRVPRKSTNNGQDVRNEIAEFCISHGRIAWQENVA